jgi:Tfp pilus assembly protein PilZ
MENRRQKRISKNLLAKVSSPSGAFFAYVQDLAKTGLGLTCNRELAQGAELLISLNMPNRPTVELLGRVAWQRSLPVISKNKYQYGIALGEANEVYQKYVQDLIARDYERRDAPRFSDVLTVENDDVLDLLDAAATDISAGGLYIRTGSPLEIGSQYEIKLSSPELEKPLFALTEVIAVFDCDLDDLDHPYGAGVKIISFAEDGRDHFAEYIQSLEKLYEFHWPSDLG